MAGIAVEHVAVAEVEHSDEEGNEHARVVAFDDGIVQRADNGVWLVDMLRDVAEQRACHCHHQRGGNAFSRYVADAEEELLVAQVEVEEVAANALGRGQLSENVDIVTLGEGREDFGQHGHLDVVGNAQLTLHGGFFRCSLLQLVHIVAQRFLHVLERVAQQSYLVMVLDVGQLHVEVSITDFTYELCQSLQWLGSMAHDEVADDECYNHADDHDDDDEYSYEVACDVDSHCRCDNNGGPSGAFDGSIEDVGGNSFEVRLEGIAVFIYQIGSLA